MTNPRSVLIKCFGSSGLAFRKSIFSIFTLFDELCLFYSGTVKNVQLRHSKFFTPPSRPPSGGLTPACRPRSAKGEAPQMRGRGQAGPLS